MSLQDDKTSEEQDDLTEEEFDEALYKATRQIEDDEDEKEDGGAD